MPEAAATRYSLSTAKLSSAAIFPVKSGPPEVPACLLPDLSPTSAETTTRWLKKHRVQAVTSQVRGMKEMLESTGLRIPQDLSLAHQGVNPRGQNSGIWQREEIIARVLIESRIASVAPGARNLLRRGREQ